MVFSLLWLVLFYSCNHVSTYGDMYVGDICTIQETGEYGRCTIIHDCTSAKEGVRRRKKPQHCGFEGFNPVVCCVDDRRSDKLISRRRNVGELSLQKCMEYSKRIYQTKANEKCPQVNEDDAGYRNAQLTEFPHTVLLGEDLGVGKSWICTAVLISENYVLTTTDCLYSANALARLGANLNYTIKFGGNLQLRNISELIPFPDYLSRNKDNNIALAKLSPPVELNEFVHPACVHGDAHLGNKFFASDGDFSFYEKSDGSYTSEGIRETKKVTLTTIPYKNCTRIFKPIGKTSERYICAALVSTSHKKQCSPKGHLLTMHPTAFCMQTVVGVNAFRVPSCDASIWPNAYTSVYNYIDWIERNVWIEDFET